MLKLASWCLIIVLAAIGIWLGFNYSRHNLETSDIDDSVRRSTPGQFVRLSDGVVHYELSGPAGGRLVVLVHGFSVPYYLWDPVVQALGGAGFRTLRYDLYGRGFSDRPNVSYNGDLYDRQLAGLLDALHIGGPLDFAGASMGGPIVATFGCRHPERIRTLSFFDPGYSHGQQMPFKMRAPGLGEYTMATEIAPTLAQGQLADFLHPERFPDWPSRYVPQMRYHGFRRALLSTLRDYLPEDWSKPYAWLGAGAAPVFLVWGVADRDVPFAVSKEVRAAIPRAEFLAVEDSGHIPFMEHPEVVNPAFLNFLAKY